MTKHNHVTRDIKPRGECPACDAYHDNPDGADADPRAPWHQRDPIVHKLVFKDDEGTELTIDVQEDFDGGAEFYIGGQEVSDGLADLLGKDWLHDKARLVQPPENDDAAEL